MSFFVRHSIATASRFATAARAAVGVSAFSVSSRSLSAAAGPPESEQDKALYAMGVHIASNLVDLKGLFSVEERAHIASGIRDSFLDADTGSVTPEKYAEAINSLLQERRKEAGGDAGGDAAQTEALEAAASEPGAVKTASGLVVRSVTDGSGDAPTALSTVTVHYEGRLVDGTVFDSSYQRNEPATFPLDGVIAGWTEGVQLMKPGGKAELTIPADLAYGERGVGPIPGGATLHFTIELLSVQ